MKKESGNIALIVLIIVLAIFVFGWLVKSGYYSAPQQTSQDNSIQNKDGLDTASKDLDDTNVNDVDVELNKLSVDTSAF